MKNKFKRFKDILGSFGLFVGVPAFVSWIGNRLFDFNEIYVLIIIIFLLWMISIECRIRDIMGVKNE